MPEKMCQFQQIVSSFFRDYSRLVAKWPLPFLVLPIMVTGVLSAGIFIYSDRLAENPSEDQLALFLPADVPAMRHLAILKKHFPPQHPIRDAYDVFRSAFAYAVFEDTSSTRNVLRNDVLRAAGELRNEVINLSVRMGWLLAGWKDVCFKSKGSCLEHPVMVLLNSTDPMSGVRYFLKYPKLTIGNQTIDNSKIFGFVTVDQDDMIRSAEALRIPFLLQDSE